MYYTNIFLVMPKDIWPQTILEAGPRHSSSGDLLASHPGGPGSSPGLVKWDLWLTKRRWGRFSPSTSVSPANLHSTNFSIIIITGAGTIGHSVADVPSGPSLDSTLHYANLGGT
jgi:hypothetical protein